MAKKHAKHRHEMPQSPLRRLDPPPAPTPQPVTDPAQGRAVMRDQRWALHAYSVVARVPQQDRRDYKIAVNDLGANILRGGLLAAVAAVQRLGSRGDLLLGHVAASGITGLAQTTATDLPARVRALDVDAYILATREALQVATWLKRAAQATFGDA